MKRNFLQFLQELCRELDLKPCPHTWIMRHHGFDHLTIQTCWLCQISKLKYWISAAIPKVQKSMLLYRRLFSQLIRGYLVSLFSCRTESAVAQEKTFRGADVGDVSKFLSASTDLVASTLLACYQHVASILPECCQHVASMLPASACC